MFVFQDSSMILSKKYNHLQHTDLEEKAYLSSLNKGLKLFALVAVKNKKLAEESTIWFLDKNPENGNCCASSFHSNMRKNRKR